MDDRRVGPDRIRDEITSDHIDYTLNLIAKSTLTLTDMTWCTISSTTASCQQVEPCRDSKYTADTARHVQSNRDVQFSMLVLTRL